MAAFETPQPIAVELEIGVGDIRISASDREDTVVEVLPTRPGKRDDVSAAEQTRVEHSGGRLLIKAPKHWRRFGPFSESGSIDVRVELPSGSRLTADAGVAALRATGRLDECRITTGVGDVALEQAGKVRARTGMGNLAIDAAGGDLDVSTGSGAVRVGAAAGAAVIKNSNGDTWLGEAGGDVRVSAANGDIAIDRTRASVVAKTAYGEVRIGQIERGPVVAETAYGGLEFGIADGTPAYLDLSTGFGHVSSELEGAAEPEAAGESVNLRARTAFGDIRVRRA
jgi:proline racemase